MPPLNYSARLSSLTARKSDTALNESALSKSASASLLPSDVRYLLESMRAIGSDYNSRTLEAATRVRNHLENNLELPVSRTYKTQGSVVTNTNIKLHSDFDLLAIIDDYHFPETKPINPYTKTEPNSDIRALRQQSTSIMQATYDIVDTSGEKGISIYNKSLHRKVDLIFCFWYLSSKYQETQDEFYKGIYLYKFPTGEKIKDYPFAAIHNINQKGDRTNDGSRKAIRLMKNLKADGDNVLKELKSFQLTTIAHSIPDDQITYQTVGSEIFIAESVSRQLGNLIRDNDYRKSVKCPKGIEYPLRDDEIVPSLRSMKEDLDTLVADVKSDLARSALVKKASLEY
ncbi:hypothetical protein KBB96_13595 [Luteolibacter ambystomatis]|uniref:cGAS/DncV-like nucleotidyltransferase C-terminal helical domain-containing protein n=1 Tax=Luteolibacter ambystomatis TaxID=2824561 RepID=A0A975G6W7_9BACT|nr:hypothetical protein [Luteolibacter ambystomatis]QUE49898.1 hypothetical protein KBB96_13595 [Luteolibacter ambystomatis]